MSADIGIKVPRTMMEVFKSLPEGTSVQLIKNNLVMSPAPKDLHQKIAAIIFNRLMNFTEKIKSGEVRYAPYDVYLDEENVFQPDIIFIANESLHKIQEDGLYGPPDVVIEVLSARTAKNDKVHKKMVYERCGVKEYWLVEPATKEVQGFSLVENKFVLISSDKGIIRSVLLNTEIVF